MRFDFKQVLFDLLILAIGVYVGVFFFSLTLFVIYMIRELL